jgi:hypothetical protein
MRASVFLVLSLTACATTNDSADNSDQQDAPVGKADAASKPHGAYTNTTPHYGELTSLALNDDHTFTLSEIGACAGGGTCAPIVETGTYLLTHSTNSSRRYVRLYAEDGSDLDRYQWKLSRGNLELELVGDDHWFTLDVGASCESAGGNCVALSPGSCEAGTVADATEYSCGSGLGVECCLPAQPDTSCTTADDCSGLLPQFCRTCDDGSQSCAHWSCGSSACEIATCD